MKHRYDKWHEGTMHSLITNKSSRANYKYLENKYIDNLNLFETSCFVCGDKIHVDVTNISKKSIFCDEHSSAKTLSKYKNDQTVVRALSILMSKVNNTIKKNLRLSD